MTGMEHAIEQAARVLIAHPSIPNHKDAIWDVCPSCPDADVAGPNSPSHAAHQARALAEAGLLAPAPLTEEWAVEMKPARTVTRDDIDRALIDVTSNAMNYPDPSQMLGKDTGPLRRKCVDAMCDLLGVEAEQFTDQAVGHNLKESS